MSDEVTGFETVDIECNDISDVIPRLTLLFSRHSINLYHLTTWRSMVTDGRQGVVVTILRPASMSVEALSKRIYRLVGVTRLRWVPAGHGDSHSIEISATGSYVPLLATAGYMFEGTPLEYSKGLIVMQFRDDRDTVGRLRTWLRGNLARRRSGDVRVSSPTSLGRTLRRHNANGRCTSQHTLPS